MSSPARAKPLNRIKRMQGDPVLDGQTPERRPRHETGFEEDLYQFQFVSSVAYAPDGRHAIFSKHQADAQTNGYHAAVAAGPRLRRLLPAGRPGRGQGALWLDAHVLFTSGREPAEGKDPQTTYYRIDIRGGEEAQRAFTVSEKVTGAQRVDDGRLLLTLSRKLDAEPDAPEARPKSTSTSRNLRRAALLVQRPRRHQPAAQRAGALRPGQRRARP